MLVLPFKKKQTTKHRKTHTEMYPYKVGVSSPGMTISVFSNSIDLRGRLRGVVGWAMGLGVGTRGGVVTGLRRRRRFKNVTFAKSLPG